MKFGRWRVYRFKCRSCTNLHVLLGTSTSWLVCACVGVVVDVVRGDAWPMLLSP